MSSANIKALNVLRGIAVLAILVRHAWGLFGSPDIRILAVNFAPWINQMSAAVDLFFVLSGVVLAISFVSSGAGVSPNSTVRFLVSRVIRIAPAYWLALTLVLIFFTPQFIESENINSPLGLHRFLVFVGFVQQFDPLAFGAFAPLSPFWTLSVEMAFYLLIPVLVKIVRVLGTWKALVASFGASISWLLLVASRPPWVLETISNYCSLRNQECGSDFIVFMMSHQIPAYLFHFVAGIAIGCAFVEGKRLQSARLAKTLIIVGAIVAIGWMWVLGTLSIRAEFWNPFNYIKLQNMDANIYFYGESLVYASAFAVLCVGLIYSGRSKNNWLERLLSFYGNIGYSVYLLHMPLLFALIRTDLFQKLANGPFRILTLPLLTLVVITVVSWIYFRAVESPLHQKARAFMRREK